MVLLETLEELPEFSFSIQARHHSSYVVLAKKSLRIASCDRSTSEEHLQILISRLHNILSWLSYDVHILPKKISSSDSLSDLTVKLSWRPDATRPDMARQRQSFLLVSSCGKSRPGSAEVEQRNFITDNYDERWSLEL